MPQAELKIFLERKARARNFLCFRWQSEQETGSWAYYRNRKREAKDFEKVYPTRSSPIFPHAPRTLCVLTEMQMLPRKPLPV